MLKIIMNYVNKILEYIILFISIQFIKLFFDNAYTFIINLKICYKIINNIFKDIVQSILSTVFKTIQHLLMYFTKKYFFKLKLANQYSNLSQKNYHKKLILIYFKYCLSILHY